MKTLLILATYMVPSTIPDLPPYPYDPSHPETASFATVSELQEVIELERRLPHGGHFVVLETKGDQNETIRDDGTFGSNGDDGSVRRQGVEQPPLPSRDGVRDELVPCLDVRPLRPEGDYEPRIEPVEIVPLEPIPIEELLETRKGTKRNGKRSYER